MYCHGRLEGMNVSLEHHQIELNFLINTAALANQPTFDRRWDRAELSWNLL
jgi:hypothetical protein